MILEHIKRYLPSPEHKILVGVSGGADSICLLDGLTRLAYPAVVAHFNHGLRPESSEEARIVAELAGSLGIPYYLGKGDVMHNAQTHARSIEEAARILRYKFLFQKANDVKADCVVVGHNADDQVETVIMNLLRGSGLSGLTGMPTCRLPNPWSNTIPLRRPLLGVWREDILAYCRSRNLTPIQDPSNKDTTFFRNRIRHEVLPVLEKNRPGFRRRVWRMANILEGDHDALQHAVDRLWEELPIEKSADYIAFEVESIVELLKGLQRRLIRRAIHYLRPGFSEISFEIVEKARDFLVDPPKRKEANLAGRVQMVVMGKRVYFATWDAKIPLVAWPQMPVNVKTVELPVPGEIHLSGAWRLRAEQVENTDEVWAQALSNKDPFRVWLDAEKVAGPLLIRTRRKGDRFSPLGMEGHSMEVTDFMINEKIPRQTRSQWPLITSHGSVIWIPGHRLAHAVRITAATDKLYFLSLDRDSGTG